MVKKFLAIACASVMLFSSVAYASQGDANNDTFKTTGADQVVSVDSVPVSEEVKNNVKELNQTGGTLNDFEGVTGDTSSFEQIGDAPIDKDEYELTSSIVGFTNPEGNMDGTPTETVDVTVGPESKEYPKRTGSVAKRMVAFSATDPLKDMAKQNEAVKEEVDTIYNETGDLSDYMIVIMNPVEEKIAYIDLGVAQNIKEYDASLGIVKVLPPIYGLLGLFQKTTE